MKSPTVRYSVQRSFALILVILGLAACTGVQVTDYKDLEPSLTPETFFNGTLSAHGVVKNRGGKVIRTFNADIDAQWKDGVGTLIEDFVFNDGEQQQRIWTLTPDGKGSYTGSAGDVVGETQLKLAGNSLATACSWSTCSVYLTEMAHWISPLMIACILRRRTC